MEQHLAGVAVLCLKEPESELAARIICMNYRDTFTDYRSSAYMAEEFAAALFRLHSTIATGTLMLHNDEASSSHLVTQSSPQGIRPFDAVADRTILDWASIDSDARVPLSASTSRMIGSPPTRS